jgi:lysophospholipase L1-like esterase
VGTWSAASDRLATTVGDQTIRMVVRTSVGGSGLRIRLSNVFGTRRLTFKNVHVGLQAYGAEIRAGTNRAVTFKGRKWVTVPAGDAVWSDPVPGKISGRGDLVVSLYLPGIATRATGHDRAYATTYLSGTGDHTADETADAFSYTTSQWYFLDRIAVTTVSSVRSVVALGDSITDGAGQVTDANRRWTDYLSYRIAQLPAAKRAGVLNVGIAGNRVLHSDVGPSALQRFNRDVLSQPGARAVVIFEGINDIHRGAYTSATPLINAYKRMIKLAHAKRLKVFGGTLTPFYGYSTWTEEREEIRRQVNTWIRTSGAYDGVIDFDRAVRDPDAPDQLAPRYDSGDHLHLNDAGRRKLASSVRLSKLL